MFVHCEMEYGFRNVGLDRVSERRLKRLHRSFSYRWRPSGRDLGDVSTFKVLSEQRGAAYVFHHVELRACEFGATSALQHVPLQLDLPLARLGGTSDIRRGEVQGPLRLLEQSRIDRARLQRHVLAQMVDEDAQRCDPAIRLVVGIRYQGAALVAVCAIMSSIAAS